MSNPPYADLIRNIPDFPQPGVQFKDITTLLQNGRAFRMLLDDLAAPFRDARIAVVVGVESRGFIFAASLAYMLGAGLVLVRKPGKLPAQTIVAEYSLEYGINSLHMHHDAIKAGDRVLIVDDVLATGGTVGATAKLVDQLGGEIVALAFAIELTFLRGREAVKPYPVMSLIQY